MLILMMDDVVGGMDSTWIVRLVLVAVARVNATRVGRDGSVRCPLRGMIGEVNTTTTAGRQTEMDSIAFLVNDRRFFEVWHSMRTVVL